MQSVAGVTVAKTIVAVPADGFHGKGASCSGFCNLLTRTLIENLEGAFVLVHELGAPRHSYYNCPISVSISALMR